MPCLKAVTPHHIVQAEEADLEAILELQRLAYQGEARLLNDFSIPPLMQTLEEMKEEFRSGIFLKAVDEKGKIVGSVRGTLRGGYAADRKTDGTSRTSRKRPRLLSAPRTGKKTVPRHGWNCSPATRACAIFACMSATATPAAPKKPYPQR